MNRRSLHCAFASVGMTRGEGFCFGSFATRMGRAGDRYSAEGWRLGRVEFGWESSEGDRPPKPAYSARLGRFAHR
jgi:hypothetical protein